MAFRWTYIDELKGWRFYEPDGTFATRWKLFTMADGEKVKHWSYFDDNGILTTGWKLFKKKEDDERQPHWVYFGKNGYLRQGWTWMTEDDGVGEPHWKYFNNKGWLHFGFYDDGQLHFLDNQGRMQTGWLKINGHFYYFNKRGWGSRFEFMKIKINGKNRLGYFDRNARLASKIKLNLKGKTYYAKFDTLIDDIERGVKYGTFECN